MYLFVIDKDDTAGKRMFLSWINPGPKHKKIPKGMILKKMASNILLFSDSLEGLRLIAYHILREPARFKIYEINELTSKELEKRIWELMPE